MESGFDRIYNYCINGPNSTLLIFGKRSNEILRKMHERALEEGHNVSWVENPKDADDFWSKISSGKIIHYDRDSIEKYTKLFKESSKRHNVFFPDLDEILYGFDVKKGLDVNKTLRDMWFDTKGLFRMYGTYGNTGNEYMKETLGGKGFALQKENFANIRDVYLL